jgi:hypothetical protein
MATIKGLGLLLLLTLLGLAVFVNLSFSLPEQLKITVTTDKSTYGYRYSVNVHGNVTLDTQHVEEGLVAVQVDNPINQPIVFRTVPVNVTPSGPFSIEVVSVVPCDGVGNPKDTFNKKTFAYFKATIRNNAIFNKAVLVAVNIFDIDLTPIGIAWEQLNVPAQQEIAYMPGLYLEDWVSTGTALACAGAYEDWPENNAAPYCPEKTANFTIGEQASQSQTPAETNGNYELTFRIPPHDAPFSGVYLVYVGASSQGRTAFSARAFIVDYEVPEDFDLNHEIEIYDVVRVTTSYGAKPGDPNWNPEVDLLPDGLIGIYDVVKVTAIYGTTY